METAAILLSTAAANAQRYARYSGSIGAAATGQFTTSLAGPARAPDDELLPQQSTTNSPGVLLSLRAYPVARAGIEFNYQNIRLQELYSNGATREAVALLPTNVREATAAYVFRLHMKRFNPYVGVGGGFTDFKLPGLHAPNGQWRETGLVDVGWNKQTHSRLGFRLGARDMIYPAPNFRNPALSSSRWVSTAEPYVGVYIKLRGE